MRNRINRRDFLKMAGLASLGILLPPGVKSLGTSLNKGSVKKNVLVIVFDAFSAYHISLYGYGRETTPNLRRLAKRATVFHNHFSGGNFTTPGTASLLTGTLPWTHRAIRLGGTVKPGMENKSIFHAFDDYHRFSYSHNTLVNTLFNQFAANIDEYIPRQSLFLLDDGLIRTLFQNDEDAASVAWSQAVKKTEGFSYSLFLADLYQKYRDSKVADVATSYPSVSQTSTPIIITSSIRALIISEAAWPTCPGPSLAIYTFYLPITPTNRARNLREPLQKIPSSRWLSPMMFFPAKRPRAFWPLLNHITMNSF